MFRFAPALLALLLASPALALPVSYDFVATSFHSGGATGTLLYDAETDSATITSFVALVPVPGFAPAPLEWIGAEVWPADPSMFPVDLLEMHLLRNDPGLDGAILETVIDYLIEGGVHEQVYDQYRLQPVPEPSAVATLLFAATALVATGSCRRRR